MGKSIIILVNGIFLKKIVYTSKQEAKIQLKHFNKRGMISHLTGEVLPNTHFELV